MDKFTFQAQITRAVKKDGKYIIEGIASSDAVDFYDTRFNTDCQKYWKEQIDSPDGMPVLLEVNHDGFEDWTKRFGKITRAEMIPNVTNTKTSDFFIQGELDPEHYMTDFIYRAINNPKTEYGQPKQLAFSVNGLPIGVESKIVVENGKTIEEYSKVPLFAVGIVELAANPTARETMIKAIKRSRENIKSEETKLAETIYEVEDDTIKENIERAISAEVPVEVETEKSILTETVKEVNDVMLEFQKEVLAIANSEVSVDNIFYVIKTFLNKYSDTAYCKICEGQYDLMDMRYEAEANLKREVKEKLETLTRNVSKTENVKIIVDDLENDKNKEENKVSENVSSEVKSEAVEKTEETKVETILVTSEIKPDETANLMRSMLEGISNLTKTVEVLTKEVAVVKEKNAEVEKEANIVRSENANLTAKVEQLSQAPASTPANQIFEENIEREISRADIIKLLEEDKLDYESKLIARSYVIQDIFGLNKKPVNV